MPQIRLVLPLPKANNPPERHKLQLCLSIPQLLQLRTLNRCQILVHPGQSPPPPETKRLPNLKPNLLTNPQPWSRSSRLPLQRAPPSCRLPLCRIKKTRMLSLSTSSAGVIPFLSGVSRRTSYSTCRSARFPRKKRQTQCGSGFRATVTTAQSSNSEWLHRGWQRFRDGISHGRLQFFPGRII